MGVTPRGRAQTEAVSLTEDHAAAVRPAAAVRTTSAYAIAGVDESGHMRKLEVLEADIIRMAIARYHGRMSEVARRLGIGRSTLYRKLKDLGLEEEAGVSPEADGQNTLAANG